MRQRRELALIRRCNTRIGIEGLVADYATELTGEVVLSPFGVRNTAFPMLRGARPQGVRTVIDGSYLPEHPKILEMKHQ